MTSKWCEDFFDQTFVDFWQTAVGEHTVQECDFLEKALLLSKGARLLDIPCGIGQHSLELARRGYVVTGVDLSSACIAHAQIRSSTEGLSVDWRRENMHCIRYCREFDACFCWGNSLGYLEREDTVEFVGAVADALKPGAQFILETGAIAESILPDFREDTWGWIDDYLALEKHRYHIAAGRLEVQFILIKDGRIANRDYTQWVYSCGEIIRMLSGVGLETHALYGSIDKTPYQLGCRDLILIARRA
jgi:SAM-dependent methyltransferase